MPAPDLVARFAADLDALVAPGDRVGIAVSGGPDSLALLLLAAAARAGAVEAATVDHGLRAGSASEAQMVAAVCEALAVPHTTLRAEWPEPPHSNVQALAREERYRLLGAWARERGLSAVATAHHLDDQAETLLLRIARGSGVAGLGGVQQSRNLCDGVVLVRPLLGWRRSELLEIIGAAGLDPVNDPSNVDERFDRSRARALLEEVDWLDPARLAAVASNSADAAQALDWAADQAFLSRASRTGDAFILDPSGLPRELKRRLLLRAVEELTGQTPPGPQLMQALATLESGAATTLAGLKLEGGKRWRLTPAPPRRAVLS